MNLEHLTPYLAGTVPEVSALRMTEPISGTEVWEALTDIDSDKAPGPDGYTMGFYKAAWPVVGDEVSKAVTQFFETGKMLRQVNATLITLAPKVQIPLKVGNFRPISCCNVLYKLISKIIVCRKKGVLGSIMDRSQMHSYQVD